MATPTASGCPALLFAVAVNTGVVSAVSVPPAGEVIVTVGPGTTGGTTGGFGLVTGGGVTGTCG